jgi:spore maturation protein CgeB
LPLRLIRKLGSRVYVYPNSEESLSSKGLFRYLKVALVTDQYTTDCLAEECQIRCLTPQNYEKVILEWEPDFVFVESAFHGAGGAWRYELPKHPSWLLWRKPDAIFKLVNFSKACGIPTVFWNKDDGAYFDAFIHVAKAFDVVLTTDKDCLPKYREVLSPEVYVAVMAMPYQPAFHHFDGFNFTSADACFAGSYYRRVLGGRRAFLDMLFRASGDAASRIQVYDRNYHRLSRRFAFSFPKLPHLLVNPGVRNRDTAAIYKRHLLSINVNSVTDSETMISRRLLEILACGGIVMTNPSIAIDREFADYCHVVNDLAEARALFERMAHGPTQDDLERARAGAEYVAKHHTWAHRLEQICSVVGVPLSRG